MKNFLLVLWIVAATINVSAQKEMEEVYKIKFNHKIYHHGTAISERPGSYSYAASDKVITVFANENGKVLWSKKFKEIAPTLKKIDELIPFWESNIIFLFDRKAGKDQVACIEMNSGKLLWHTDVYQNVYEDVIIYIPEENGFAISLKKELVFIDAKTGKVRWRTPKFKGVVAKYIYVPADNSMVMINFIPNGLASLFSGFKNQIMRINTSTGEILWDESYIGRAKRKALTREFVFDMQLKNDKIFLLLNGIQLFDYKTGTPLWSAAFNFIPEDVIKTPNGASGSFGVYNAVAKPVVQGDDVYILDMSNRKNQYLKKYDRNSGKLLWTSSDIKKAKAIPGLAVYDDKAILQIGGRVEMQYKRKYMSGDTWVTEWKIDYPEVKPFGIKAINTTDGALAWESEKFKKGITNAISFDKNYIVCSGKDLYSIDVATGKTKFQVPVSKGGVGQANMILPYKDNIVVVVGEKGVSTFNAETGNLLNSGKYKASGLNRQVNNILIMETPKNDIAAFDLNTCKYKSYNAKKGANTSLTMDGKYVYVYEKNAVSKLKTY